MSSNRNPSPSFFFSSWKTESKKIDADNYKETPYRVVCQGMNNECRLTYQPKTETYNCEGACRRNTFCTELRILKDIAVKKSGRTENPNASTHFLFRNF